MRIIIQLVLLFSLSMSTLVASAKKELWGLTANGGAYSYGTIFKTNAEGMNYQTVYSFKPTDGTNPAGSLIQASDGMLYGTCRSGGKSQYGTIFSFNPNTGKHTIEAHMSASLPAPVGGLVEYKGRLYGLCTEGGANGYGAIFEFEIVSKKLSLIFSFPSAYASPVGDLVVYNGNLVGVCRTTSRSGAIFEVNISTHKLVYAKNFPVTTYNALTSGLTIIDKQFWGIISVDVKNPDDGAIYTYDSGGSITIKYTFKNDVVFPCGKLIYDEINGKLLGTAYKSDLINTVVYSLPYANLNFSSPLNISSIKYRGISHGGLCKSTDNNFYFLTNDGGVNGIGSMCVFNYSNTSIPLLSFPILDNGGLNPQNTTLYLADIVPQIILQPHDITTCVNTNAKLSASAVPADCSYSWYKVGDSRVISTDSVLSFVATSSSAGSYFCVIKSGVDIIYSDTVLVTVPQTATSTTTVSSCGEYYWNGVKYTNSGLWSKTLKSITTGCDSVAMLNLTILPPVLHHEYVSACGSYSLDGSLVVEQDTTVATVYERDNGLCDSIVHYHISIHKNPEQGTFTASGCDSVLYMGNYYKQSGSFTDTLLSIDGCDSIVAVTLSVNTSRDTTIYVTTRDDVYFFNEIPYYNSGNYTIEMPQSTYCVRTANLILTMIDTTRLHSAIVAAQTSLNSAHIGTCRGEYSPEVHESFAREIAIAHIVLASDTASQSTIDATAQSLIENNTEFANSAIAVDMATYDSIRLVAKYYITTSSVGNSVGQYPDSSFQRLTGNYEAVVTYINSQCVTQVSVDSVTNFLEEEITIFESSKIEIDKSLLSALIDSVYTKYISDVQSVGERNGDYRKTAYDSLNRAYMSAEIIKDKATASQQEVNDGYTSLNEAESLYVMATVVVDYKPLQTAVDSAQQILDAAIEGSDVGCYAAADTTTFYSKIQEARRTLGDYKLTAAQLHGATQQMYTDIDWFYSVQISDSIKTLFLREQLAAANTALETTSVGMGDGQCSQVSKDTLSSKIERASAVLQDIKHTQTQINEASIALRYAIDAFNNEKITVNRDSLRSAISNAKMVLNATKVCDYDGCHSADDSSAFSKTYNDINNIFLSAHPTQAAVDSFTALLASSIELFLASEIIISKDECLRELNSATALLLAADVGSRLGQYHQLAVDTLKRIATSARTAINTSTITQPQADSVEGALAMAIIKFKAGVVAAKTILYDAEDGLKTSLGTSIFTFSNNYKDSVISTINTSIEENNNNHYLQYAFGLHSPSVSTSAYAGAGFDLDKKHACFDARSYAGIEFMHKGAACNIQITNDTSTYTNYAYPVRASNEWVTYSLRWSDLKQMWGDGMEDPMDSTLFFNMQWTVDGNEGDTGVVAIDNVYLIDFSVDKSSLLSLIDTANKLRVSATVASGQVTANDSARFALSIQSATDKAGIETIDQRTVAAYCDSVSSAITLFKSSLIIADFTTLDSLIALAKSVLQTDSIGSSVNYYPSSSQEYYTAELHKIEELKSQTGGVSIAQITAAEEQVELITKGFIDSRISLGSALFNAENGNNTGFATWMYTYSVNASIFPITNDTTGFAVVDGGAMGTAHAAKIDFDFIKDSSYSMAAMQFDTKPNNGYYDLTGTEGISFWHKGPACVFKVMTNNASWQGYTSYIDSSSVWRKVYLQWSNITAEPTMPPAISLDSVKSFGWIVEQRYSNAQSLWIDEVKLEGELSDMAILNAWTFEKQTEKRAERLVIDFSDSTICPKLVGDDIVPASRFSNFNPYSRAYYDADKHALRIDFKKTDSLENWSPMRFEWIDWLQQTPVPVVGGVKLDLSKADTRKLKVVYEVVGLSDSSTLRFDLQDANGRLSNQVSPRQTIVPGSEGTLSFTWNGIPVYEHTNMWENEADTLADAWSNSFFGIDNGRESHPYSKGILLPSGLPSVGMKEYNQLPLDASAIVGFDMLINDGVKFADNEFSMFIRSIDIGDPNASDTLTHYIGKPYEQSIRVTIDTAICLGDTAYGYSNSGTYVNVTEISNGPDSVQIINLSVNPTFSITQSLYGCESMEYEGKTYKNDTTFISRLSSTKGCDSIVSSSLTIRKPYIKIEKVEACDSLILAGNVIKETGTYQSSVGHTKEGCDSIVYIQVIISKPTDSTLSVAACNSFDFNGVTYTETGQYTIAKKTAAGCDSTIRLDLTIRNSRSYTQELQGCDSVSWKNNTYTKSNIYTVYESVNGCTDTVSLHVTVGKDSVYDISRVADDYYFYNGQKITESCVLTDTFATRTGCDSIVRTSITINTGVQYVSQVLAPANLGIVKGQAQQLLSSLLPANATERDLSYQSLDEKIVTIDSLGMIYAADTGKAYVIVSAKKSATSFVSTLCLVTVTSQYVALEKFEVSPRNLSLVVGESKKLNASFTPSNASKQKIVWTTSSPYISVSDDGLVTALKHTSNIVKIYAEHELIAESSMITVSIKPSYAPVLSPLPEINMHTAQDSVVVNLAQLVSDDNSSDKQIRWEFTSFDFEVNTFNDTMVSIKPLQRDSAVSEIVKVRVFDIDNQYVDASLAIHLMKAPNQAPRIRYADTVMLKAQGRYVTYDLSEHVTDDYTMPGDLHWLILDSAQHAIVELVGSRIFFVSPIDMWTGNDSVEIMVIDGQNATSSVVVPIKISDAPNKPPVVSTIPSQKQTDSVPFAPINLRKYVQDDYTATENITWTVSGSSKLSVDIKDGFATIFVVDPNWLGLEILRFTAKDEEGASSYADVVFLQTASASSNWMTKPRISFEADRKVVGKRHQVTLHATILGANSWVWEATGADSPISYEMNPTFTYSKSGKYSIQLKAMNKVGVDSLVKTDYIAVAGIETVNTAQCKGTTVYLMANVIDTAYIYKWSNGDDEEKTSLDVASDTTITLTIQNGAFTYSDFVTFTINKPVSLSGDVVLCKGDTARLFKQSGDQGSVIWTGNGIVDSLGFYTTQRGTIRATLTDINGCVSTDSATITVNELPVINLGEDKKICQSIATNLDAGMATSYVWNTGARTRTIAVDSSRTYTVTITDGNSCKNSDTVTIEVLRPFKEQISVVTHSDENESHTVIAWQKTLGKRTLKYAVYQEKNATDSYTKLIGVRNFNDKSYIVDTETNQSITTYKYKLVTYDSTCMDSVFSDAHRTMHLQTFTESGGDKVGLKWNPYEGIPINSYVIYKILPNKKEIILDTLPGDDSEMSYSDTSLPRKNVRYRVAFLLPKKIDLGVYLKSDGGPYSQSISNLAESQISIISGDIDGDGVINGSEICGDIDLDGIINNGEICGDIDGDKKFIFPEGDEIIGDRNGDGTIGTGEVAGDANGNGILEDSERQTISFNEHRATAMKTYPIPAGEKITIELEEVPSLVQVLSLNGRVLIEVLNPSSSILPLNLDGLIPSLYMLRVVSSMGDYTSLFAKD